MSSGWISRWLKRPKPFRAADFERRSRYRDDYRRIAGFLLERLDFDSVYDVGCANAFLLEVFADRGREVGGIEVSPEVVAVLPERLAKRITIGDFADASGAWDLVCCVEVAEHIEPARSLELVTTLARLARRWLYFTAAPPGQSGHGHINCRPHAEWLAWLADAGWRVDNELTAALREHLEPLSETPWLRTNSFLLRREG